ncbi:MAG: right-handed parallel beta-helix repeat-containing protein, partial [Candidatus Hodarchaeales archaeon]
LFNTTATHNKGSGYHLAISSLTNLTHNFAFNNKRGFRLDESEDNIFTNNRASSNSLTGFELFNSSTNTFINNIATNHNRVIPLPPYVAGFLSRGNNNTFINNSGIDNTLDFYLSWGDNNILLNNSARDGGIGFFLGISNNNILANNTVSNAKGDGFQINGNNNILTGNVAIANMGYGISITPSRSNNRLISNNFIDNKAGVSQARDDGSDNEFFANYWNDWTTPDSNQDGVVDQPYLIEGNANNHDFFPRVVVQTQIQFLAENDIENNFDGIVFSGILLVVLTGFSSVVLVLGLVRGKKQNLKQMGRETVSDVKKHQSIYGPHQEVIDLAEKLVQESKEMMNKEEQQV